MAQEDSKESGKHAGVNKDLWAEAEHAAVNQTGGFAGVGAEGKKIQIQEKYDQMLQNDKDIKKWAGNEDGPGGILGEVS